MAGDADTFLVETSAGQVTVQYGWNRWVTVSGSNRPAQKAVVASRRGLERLLVETGIPPSEARSHAKRLWSDRPGKALRRGEAEAWEGPWKQHSYGTLTGFVIAVLVAVLFIVVLKFDWVGI